MKKLLVALIGSAWLLAPLTALAEERTVTLKVDGMTCASCPYQVQSALKRVDGVLVVVASMEKANAVVTFDDAVTNVTALTKAMTDAGFPSVLDTAASKRKGS